MAERLAYLEAVVGADITQFRKGMRDVRNETGLLSETVGGLGKIGRTLTFAYTAPLLALGSYAVQTAGQFDASMRNINAIAQLPIDQLDALSDRVLAFGKNTREGVTAAADALYTVFSAGLTDSETAFRAMEVSVRTAEAGLADVTTTTESLVAVMLSYGDTTDEFMQRASDSMTQMVAVGVGSMQEFASGMGKVIPTASALGMSVEELMGDMAFLTQRGLSASTASTSLNAALTSLIKPTEAMQQAFRQLGVQGAEQLIEQTGGVNGALKALIGTTDGTQASLQALFNNIRGARAINQFANNIDAWDSSMAEFMSTVEGATMRAWEQQAASFMATWDRFTSALEGAAIVIGQQLIPVVEPLLKGFTNFLNTISDAHPRLLAIGVAITGITVIIPPLIWAFTSLVTPVGLLISGLIALGSVLGGKLSGALVDITTKTAAGAAAMRRMFQAVDEIFGTDLWEDPVSTDGMLGDFDPGAEINEMLLTSTIPTSLWSFYEGSDFMETMSWDEFIDLATEGGWDGGAITPDNPVTIEWGEVTTIPLLDDDVRRAQAEQELQDILVSQMSWFERMKYMWQTEGKTLITSFNHIWNQLLTTGVPLVTDFITGLTTAIDEIDFNKIPEAIKAALGGDIDAFMTTIFGEDTGSAITQILSDMFETDVDTSGLSTAASNLWTTIGDTISTEAVPALAHSVGYIIGRFGNLIKTGLQQIPALLSGTGDASSYFAESINRPFMEGLEAASAEMNNDVNGMGMGGILDSVLGILAVGAIFAPGTLMAVAGALSTGVSMAVALVPIVIAKSAAIGAAALGIVSATFTAIGTAFTAGAVGFSATLATMGSVSTAVIVGIKAFFTSIAASIAGGGALAIGTAVAGVIAAGIGIGAMIYEHLIPQEVKDNLHNGFWNIMDGVFATDDQTARDRFANWANSMGYALGDAIGDVFGHRDIEGGGLNPIPVEVPIEPEAVLPEGENNLLGNFFNAQSAYANGTNLDLGVAETIDNAVTSELNAYTPSEEALNAVNEVLSSIVPSVDEEGNVTAQPFIDGYLVPLEEAWLARFGAEGSMYLAWAEFSQLVIDKMMEVQNLFVGFPAKAINPLNMFMQTVVTTMTVVHNELDDVNKQLVAMIWNLKQLANGGLFIETQVMSSPNSHQAGLSNVPYDGYQATLHKGERVLTSAENRRYEDMSAQVVTGGQPNVNNNTTNANQITVHGITNVEELLNELERYGIELK